MMSKRAVLTTLLLILLLTSVLSGAVLEERKIAQVGKEAITERDLLFLLSTNVGDQGDGMRTALALVQMDERARLEMTEGFADQLLLSMAAQRKKLHEDPEIARIIRWQEIQTLAGAYLAEIGSAWDLSEEAAKSYYEEHPDEFIQAEAVKIRSFMMTASADVTILAKAASVNPDFDELAHQYDIAEDALGMTESPWMEKGLIGGDLERLLFESDVRGLLSPITSEAGTRVIEVTDRRPARLLTWEEARVEARQRLQRFYLRREIETQRSATPVSIDVEVLNQLGK